MQKLVYLYASRLPRAYSSSSCSVTGALELLVDRRSSVQAGGCSVAPAAVQSPFELGIVQPLAVAQSTPAAGPSVPRLHRALASSARGRSRVTGRLQVQAQDFSYLAHRDPGCRHGSAKKHQPMQPKRSLARPDRPRSD